MLTVLEQKVMQGWDVPCVDGSNTIEGGWGLQDMGEGDERNEQAAILVSEKQSITRAEPTAPLRALQKKCPGRPSHLVTDSEL